MDSAILRDLIRPGDLIVAGQALGEPTALIAEVFAAVADVPGVRMFAGMSLTTVFPEAPPGFGLCSFVGMPPFSDLIADGRLDLIPAHMSALPRLFAAGPLKADVVLVSVSPPDAEGFCSLGVVSDYVWPAVHSARVVIAEINDAIPVVAGETRLHVDTFAATMKVSHPLPEYRAQAPSALEQEIGRHVAGFVRDRSCVQVGIGKLAEAVLHAVVDRRDLSIHSGMIGDTALALMRDGVVTNRFKEIDEGRTVAGSILGSARGVALAAAEPRLDLRSVSYTHDPGVVGSISNFVCVNSALEVDLFGQVNSEVAGSRYVGAVGGSVDFLRAAVVSPGGRAIVALPTTASRGRSRIVPQVARVTAAGADVDVVVTEYGVADLRGVSASERARRIVAVAAPEHRETLTKAATEAGL
ncbi:acetyl-CoA hydrolase/transferase family protein [Sporichthya polymorpha]|uniref:acetyl-CoA hydrolase/transferase family protein n=1 Tax=Sporichthya polymorpha TaxID=35751 RepID=UPI00036B9D80|nr:acetyl-CoA hydrolase/transferase C-terminal domain-containing protein [Sporichthya polymorpha]